jgi:hypothetical protein
MAVPVTLGLLFFSSRGGGQRQDLASSGGPAASASLLKAGWSSVKQNISERAGLEIYDDFRSGLSSWQGRDDWSSSWGYDQTGFVRTGSLALYTPTMNLSDYKFEFLGRVDKKGMGWVFRAKDLDNYYVTKVVVTRNGRLPVASVVHYAVIKGKEGPHKETPLPFQVQADTLYRVRVELRGSDFTTSVQDQVVDTWSDDRLKKGGIGFFNSKGEQSLLRWVTVSHQYDTLGRLCAMLAPYSLQPTKGEWSQ